MFKGKKLAWLTAIALIAPIAMGFGTGAAQAAASSTSLQTLTVNGQDAMGDSPLNLDVSTLDKTNGVLSVDVVATASDPVNTNVDVSGSTGLSVGQNTLTVTVSDKDDLTIQTVYTKTLVVLNNDTSSVIVVNSEELVNGEQTIADWGTTSVPVSVTPTDPNATVKVNGSTVNLVNGVANTTVSGLTTGDNTVSILVTAPNGESDESLIGVSVAPNTDTFATFTIDGVIADDGDIVPLDAATTDPDIEVTTRDVNASFEIIGGSDLIPGENRLTIYVTAEDGVTFQQYDFTLMVSLDDDASATIRVNGTIYGDGDSLTVAYQTSSVNVSVTLGDPDASYVILGNDGLRQGDNDLLVTVYAPDGITVVTYAITVTVGDPDVTLSTLQFNGVDIADQGTAITTTLQNTLTIVPTDSRATISVDGGTYDKLAGTITLQPGQNDVVITVLGDDKSTTNEIDLTLGVLTMDIAWEGNTDGQSVSNGDTVNVPGSVTMVDVTPTAPFDGWITQVEGDKDLDFGNNTVNVSFYAPDNSVIVKSFTVFVGPADLSLSSLSVNDNDVTLTGFTGSVHLDPHTTTGVVAVETADDRSTFTITGGSNLRLGNNTITIVVTGADGRTATYTVTAIVDPSDNADVNSISINGVAVNLDADVTEVDAGTLSIGVDTADDSATTAISLVSAAVADPTSFGGSATSLGDGQFTASGFLTLKVTVTAENGVAADPIVINLIASKDFDVISGSIPSTDTLRVGTYAKSTLSTVQSFFPAGTRLTYKWLKGGMLIANQSTSRYLLQAADYNPDNSADNEIRPVVSGLVGGVVKTYVGQKLEVSKGIIPLSSVPSISGKPQIGQTLTAMPRRWANDVEFAYTWFVNGVAVQGQTTENLDLTSGVVNSGDLVTVSVTGSLEGYEDLTKTSSPVTVLPGVISIITKPEVTADSKGFVTGAVLTVSAGTTTKSDAATQISWYRDGVAISGANQSTYTATTADFGKRISVVVAYSAQNYTGISITVKSQVIKQAALPAPATVTLSLNQSRTALIATGGYSTAVPASSVKYTWYRNGRAVIGQNSANYTLSSKDAGATISVRVVATYLGYLPTTTQTSGSGNFTVNN